MSTRPYVSTYMDFTPVEPDAAHWLKVKHYPLDNDQVVIELDGHRIRLDFPAADLLAFHLNAVIEDKHRSDEE